MSEGQPSNPITKNAPEGETGNMGTKPGEFTGKPEKQDLPLDYGTPGAKGQPEKPYTLDGE